MIRKYVENAFTVEEALKELSGRVPLFHPEVKEPSKQSIDKVIEAAKRTGDLQKLSLTDIKLIALALDLKATLVTDDFAMQNVASFLGIDWLPVELSGIKEVRTWIFVCKNCKRTFESYPGDTCPFCGGKVVRKTIRRHNPRG